LDSYIKTNELLHNRRSDPTNNQTTNKKKHEKI